MHLLRHPRVPARPRSAFGLSLLCLALAGCAAGPPDTSLQAVEQLTPRDVARTRADRLRQAPIDADRAAEIAQRHHRGQPARPDDATLAIVASEARKSFYEAVAAQQLAELHTRARSAAEVARQLAQRMEDAGHFSALDRLREQAFHAEAEAQLTRAQQQAVATRERLLRALGQEEAPADVALPTRLPELPTEATAAVPPRAPSAMREAHAAYRSAYTLARHQRDELLPLRQRIAEEQLLRYNGMLISVFELLAEARGQIDAAAASVEALRDFWLAETDLRTALHTGTPPTAPRAARAPAAPAPATGH